jgi:hypothetical protein
MMGEANLATTRILIKSIIWVLSLVITFAQHAVRYSQGAITKAYKEKEVRKKIRDH